MVNEDSYVVYKTWYPKIFGFTYFVIRNRNIYKEELLEETTPILYTNNFDIATNIVIKLREEYRRN
ncbi:hypothetical protein [Lactococcus phage P1048]|uniref:Uncharacterized protein n=1 Tax=Lactococcus phage P1048 TaxID=2662295 RepID=A0A649V2Q3_9CAUD|nr:hypothetical protein H1Z36_gp041 [Lactococcus phage P1048]QGJ84922.1 hypothetical protein [Lactococcus phage P1048]